MGQLFFKKVFFPAIREGRKVTTVRRWSGPRVRAGQRVFSPGLGWLAVEAVEGVSLDRLSDRDAQADGFACLADMMAVLREMYPTSDDDGRAWYRVRFSFLGAIKKATTKAKSKRRKKKGRAKPEARGVR